MTSNVIHLDTGAADDRAKFRTLLAVTAAKPEPDRSDSVLVWLGVNLRGELLRPAEIFRLVYGPAGVQQFWHTQFLTPMEFHRFVDVMATVGAASDDDRVMRAAALKAAVMEALHAGLPFVSLAGASPSITVHPLQAAVWLHGDKLRRHLVPRSLAMLLPTQAPRTVAKAARQPPSPLAILARPRGPAPVTRQRVADAMRTRIIGGGMTTAQLREQTEQTLANTYGVNRSTARKARQIVLSEFPK